MNRSRNSRSYFNQLSTRIQFIQVTRIIFNRRTSELLPGSVSAKDFSIKQILESTTSVDIALKIVPTDDPGFVLL